MWRAKRGKSLSDWGTLLVVLLSLVHCENFYHVVLAKIFRWLSFLFTPRNDRTAR